MDSLLDWMNDTSAIGKNSGFLYQFAEGTEGYILIISHSKTLPLMIDTITDFYKWNEYQKEDPKTQIIQIPKIAYPELLEFLEIKHRD
jgi:hypothetical protein